MSHSSSTPTGTRRRAAVRRRSVVLVAALPVLLAIASIARASASTTVPQPGFTDRLNSVSCVSATSCWAVGSTRTSPDSNTDLPDVLHWDGSGWQEQAAPAALGELQRVACVSDSTCWASGDGGHVARFDGSTWSVATFPNVGRFGDIADLSCVSDRDCWAVGANRHPFAYHWNGSRWQDTAIPTQGQADTLTSISCVAAADCWAMGQYFGPVPKRLRGQETSPGYLTALHWNGTRWHLSWTSAAYNAPDGLSLGVNLQCTAAAQCVAAGSALRGIVSTPVLLRYTGGKWTTVTARLSHVGLDDLSCAGTDDCWIVGYMGQGLKPHPLIIHWSSGADLTRVSAPAPAESRLEGVSCASPSACLAVGGKGVEDGNVAVRWDGHQWSGA